MPRLYTILLIPCLSFPLLCGNAFPDATTETKTLGRFADPVTIDGLHMPPLNGKNLSGFRLFTFRGGVPVSIPFQIDQRDSRGDWVWDTVYTHNLQMTYDEDVGVVNRLGKLHHGLTYDDQDPPDQELLDGNDVLVFMARDTGDRNIRANQLLNTDMLQEIEVLDPVSGGQGWAYIAHYETAPPPPSPGRYMRYLPEERQIISPVYEFTYSEDHVALLKDLAIDGIPILDRVNIQGDVELKVGFINKNLHFNEEDIHGHVEGCIAGPVRIIKRNIAHLKVGKLLRTPEVSCDHFYYPSHAEVPVCLSMRFPVVSTSMRLTADYRNSPFYRVVIGSGRQHHATTAGSAATQQVDQNWIALDGATGSVISLVTLPQEIELFARASPYLHQITDQDTDSGCNCVAGFQIHAGEDCPPGEHTLYGTYLISTQPFESGNENELLDLIYRKLLFRIESSPAPAPDRPPAH